LDNSSLKNALNELSQFGDFFRIECLMKSLVDEKKRMKFYEISPNNLVIDFIFKAIWPAF